MTLNGQNFRVFSGESVIGMATNCSVTLGTSTQDASTKDDVGMAAKPTVDSKNWQVQVDSLDVTDMAAMLTAIKNQTPFTLMWDETSTTDNQTALGTTFARTGSSFLSDATFTFNDRENSAKSLQFTGTGALSKVTSTPSTTVLSAGSYTKGQFVRLFLGADNTAVPAAAIAYARQLQLHISLTLENATTKDTTGDWVIQEVTGLSYDISTTALVRSNDTITSAVAGKTFGDLEDIYEASNPVRFQIANVSGDNQRTKGSVLMSGSVILSQLVCNAPNRQAATWTATLNGYGTYTVGA